MKKTFVIISILVVIIALIALYCFFMAKKTTIYQTVKIERGDIVSTVSTTGNIKYKNSIGVYSLQSGIVEKVYVDNNQKVKKGSLLAILEHSQLQLSLKESYQELIKNSNSFLQAKKEYEDTLALYNSGYVSEKELEDKNYSLKATESTLKSSQIAYEKALLNFNQCFIRSPASGVVISKNIEEGTNILANTLLFTIVENPQDLEIEALVDENEIGKIKTGQKVSFTVGAFSDKTFYGKVTKIKYEPEVVQNVVNYPVVISIKDNTYSLLPGMTANIDIVTEEKTNIFKVINSALRFRPSQNILKKITIERKIPPQTGSKRNFSKEFDGNIKVLWIFDRKNNSIKPLPVKTGVSDGKYTEIIPLKDENIEGLEIVYSTTSVKKNIKNQSGPMFFGPPPR